SCSRRALKNGFVEETRRRRRPDVSPGAVCTRRLSENGHVARVASERFDISLHPLERELLIHEPIVPRGMPLLVQRRMREEATDVQTIVDRHDPHAALLHELDRVVVAALSSVQAAAVNPDHHRTPAPTLRVATLRFEWGYHVQVQAIFLVT